MEKTAMRRDENLLKKAQVVFGEDLVVNAFVCTWSKDYSTSEEVSSRLDFASKACEGGATTECPYDGATIRLVFSNGRTVEFTNSEWASMRLAEDDGYEA
jgi:hypothetical protein